MNKTPSMFTSFLYVLDFTSVHYLAEVAPTDVEHVLPLLSVFKVLNVFNGCPSVLKTCCLRLEKAWRKRHLYMRRKEKLSDDLVNELRINAYLIKINLRIWVLQQIQILESLS